MDRGGGSAHRSRTLGGRWTIRRQLLVFTAAVAAPLLVLIFHTAHALATQASEHASATAIHLARHAARNVARELDEARVLAERLAARPLVRALVPGACDPIFTELLRIEPSFRNAVTVSPGGELVCSARSAPPGLRVPAAATDGLVSNVVWDGLTRRWVAIVARPLPAPDGGRASVQLVLDLGAVGRTFADVLAEPGVQVFVVDEQGVLVAAGDAADSGRPAAERGLPVPPPGVGEGTSELDGPDGRSWVLAHVAISGTHWRAVAALPASAGPEAARAQAFQSALAAAAALVAMLAFAILLGARITGPIAALAEAARALGRGEDAPVPLAGPLEVTEVAAELNAAIAARRRTEEIERAAEASLRRSERRHRELSNLVSELAASYVYDDDGRLRRDWSTESFDRFLGASAAERSETPALGRWVHPEDLPPLEAEIARLSTAPSTGRVESRVRRSDGAWRWVRHEMRSLPDEEPGRMRLLLSCQDVTDAREAARLREERLAWERLSGALSRRFLAVPPDALEAELAAALEQVRAFADVDQVALYEVAEGGAHALAFARRSGTPEPLALARVADFPGTHAQLLAGDAFAFAGLAEVQARARRDLDAYRALGIEAGFAQPLFAAGGPLGFLWLGCLRPRPWPGILAGQIGGIAEVLANAFARMLADRALRASEARYRGVVEHAGDGILLVDPESGAILDANARAAELTGRSAEALSGSPYLGLFRPDVDAERLRTVAVEGADPAGRPVEAAVVRPDRSEVPVEIASTLVAVDGRPRLLSIVRDLSLRRKAEAETRQLKEFYAAILESVREGILVTDADDVIRYVNRAEARALGVGREQLVGSRIVDAPAPGCGEALEAQYLRARTLLQPVPYEGRVSIGGGAPLLQAGWLVPLVSNGRYDGMLCTAEDVTERRAVEEMLRRTQEQFLQAQKMEAVGRLAGGVAHDFNNILSVILSYAELLSDELPEQDPRRPDLLEIVRAGRAGANLTRQLLAFSRKQVAEPRVLRLGELVGGAQKLLKRLIGEDIALEVSGLDAPFRARVDPGHIEQVLLNLAVNARDAMPEGGRLRLAVASVALEAAREDAGTVVPAGRWVTLAVEDTGCGMDEATRGHAFEPFFSTKGPGKGTGLGLATVYGIVQQAGGHVALTTAPGQGTAFRFYFPLVEDAAEGDAPPADATLPSAAPVPSAGTVLVVEDDGALREAMRRVLAASGYDVVTAASGAEALAAAERLRAPIALLVSDVVMPGMNGRELSNRLAALRPGLRTLFLSGYTEDILGPHGVLDPGVHLLHKPFTQPQLLEAIRRRLQA